MSTTAVEVTGLTIGDGDIYYQVDGDMNVDLNGRLPDAEVYVLVCLGVDGGGFDQVRQSDRIGGSAYDDLSRTIEVLTAVRDALSDLR